MLEAPIENSNRVYAKSKGVAFYKFTSPGHRSVPDRLLLSKIPEELRPIVAKYVQFVEYKATGKKATEKQLREHERLRNLGFVVTVIDDIETGKLLIDEMV